MIRKHRAKHTAQMLRWPKRVLALCFAMILVCSCLLPAFADETDEALETTALAEADESFGIAALPLDGFDDAFGVVPADQLDDDGNVDFGIDTGMVDEGETPITDPVPAGDETPTETPGKVSTDADGNIVITYDPTDIEFPDDGIISRPEEGMLEELDPGFAIPTNLYRFWLKEMDAYELADVTREAEMADMSEVEYLSHYGDTVGLYSIQAIADGANLADYRLAPPSSVDDPEGLSRSFEGWYTRDELGDEHAFAWDETLFLSASQTVDVFAKWEDPDELVQSDEEDSVEDTEKDSDSAADADDALLDAGIVSSAGAALTDKAASSNKIKVYVYVATTAKDGSSWAKNEEFLDLLKIDPETIDGNGYFPVGIIYLDQSFLNGKGQAAATAGEPLITNDADWNALMDALSVMDNNSMDVVPYTDNNGNKVGEYLSQASRDYNRTWGSQRTALFRWNMTESYGFQDQTVEYHLDLQFNTNKIKFITGNNGIDFPDYASDGTEVDSRTYITGSEIQSPRNLQIPEGYEFVGYYEDPNFDIPWDKIGTPLNEDEVVYIQITPNPDVTLNYVVAKGEGIASPDNEILVRGVGEAVGSTAIPAAGWAFEGWYYDEECTEPVLEEELSDTHFTPTKPEDGWVDATYYAKFIQTEKNVEISKTVTGLMGEHDRSFAFEVTDAAGATHGFSLTDGESTANNSTISITAKAGDTLTLKETNAAGYRVKAVVSCKDGTTRTFEAPEALDEETKTLIIEVTEEMLLEDGIHIEVCNNRDLIPDNGVQLETQPYVLLLGMALAGIAVWANRRRGQDEA